MNITHLGEAKFKSPIARNINDNLRVPEHIIMNTETAQKSELSFELAGPREKLFLILPKHAQGL
jgi:hypothetical protein